MRDRFLLAVVVGGFITATLASQSGTHLNRVIDLLAAHKPVFGVYAPRNPRTRPGATVPDTARLKTPTELAKDALGYMRADYVFDGSTEGDYDRAFPAFSEFAKGIAEGGGGMIERNGATRFHHPLIVKVHEIAPDPAKATQHIGDQLNLGVSGVVFVGVESKAGLARVREIAAVQGIGVLFPGAGTLRGVFTTTDANGQRVFDEKGWEAAIQQVLAACKEFNVPCGYPATANDIEARMQQGFSVFVINWGEQGFKAVDIGRRVGNRESGIGNRE